MILSLLQIRDYKQFAGEFSLELESQGIIGVIGPNGAGKTTLFEAIEWCLYGPRSIATADVFPRGREGKPLVHVVLEHPDTGEQYHVEREIRGKTMRASVWRDDRPEDILATGSAPVRAYVSEKLIGLGHDAFVSTFFTRQKELSFFGSLRPTERRVMIGRLIGVEAVRLAQESIGLERSQAAQRADGLAAQVEHEQQGRDFAAEITAAEERAQAATELVDLRSAEHATTRDALERAEKSAEVIHTREQRDRQFADELAVPEQIRVRVTAEIAGIEREIARLEQERLRRAPLLAIAEQQPEHLRAVEHWNRERERRQHLDSLHQRVERLRREQETTTAAASRLVTETQSTFVPDWRWNASTEVESEIDRLLTIESELDPLAAQSLAQQLERLSERTRDHQRAETELTRYRTRLDSLRAEERTLLAEGDPSVAIERLTKRVSELQVGANNAQSEAAQAEQHLSELRPLVSHLREHKLGGLCPTCGREVAEGEYETVLATLEKQAASWDTLQQSRRRDAKQAMAAQDEHQRLIVAEQKRLSALAELRTRFESGQQFVADKAKEVESYARDVAGLLKQSGRAIAPTPEEVENAKARATALSSISQAALALRQRLSQISDTASSAAALASEIAEIGEVAYNETAHQTSGRSLEESNSAIATLAQIDRDLARQPKLHIEIEHKRVELAEATGSWASIAKLRADHAFDPAESVQAREGVAAATRQERFATTALHDAQTSLRDRLGEAKAIKREQTRLSDLFDRSIAIRREADELDRMYREFAAFDQFVAARIAPRLAEQTSELLGYATDGKYDRVEFDENYGIHVFDGDDDKFALEGFSGGERDVVALCARLALSQVIASAAANPPSFLVLDEVFGALDRDRRGQLLDLLGQLSEQTSQFQQMFVISHVDDVRSSPVFSRVWRIIETEDGISRIEDATGNGAKFDE
jgi:exonuclease SbcC